MSNQRRYEQSDYSINLDLDQEGVDVLSQVNQYTLRGNPSNPTLSFSKVMQLCSFSLVVLSLYLGLAQPAFAKSNNLDLAFSVEEEVFNFRFSAADQSVDVAAIKVERDLPNRLKLTIDGHRCKRAWQKGKEWKAKGIGRALLYPSKEMKKRCFLKVRMKRKISNAQVKAIQKISVDDDVVIRFAWNPENLVRAEDASIAKEETSIEALPEKKIKERLDVLDDTIAQVQLGQPLTEEDSRNTSNDEDGNQSEETSSAEVLEEVEAGDFPDMDLQEDKLGIQERPHRIVETVTIGQVEKARAYSPAPVIFSTPLVVSNGDYSEKEEEFLNHAALLFSELLDQEAKSRGGSIWITDPNLRQQIKLLNSNVPKLSISQERLVAEHVGANLISRTQLNFNKTDEGQTQLSLGLSMTPVNQEGTIQESDPGVYRVEHNISRAMIEEALKQTWVEEKRNEMIWRSVFLPGLGHLYRGEKRLGWTYLSSSMTLAAGAILSSTLGYLASKDYDGNSPSTAHRRQDANAHYDRANLLWMGVATLYATSLVDILVSAEDRSYLDISRLDWDKARDGFEQRRNQ